jgi:F0F1-type ATP synthase membrane subunit b/b'
MAKADTKTQPQRDEFSRIFDEYRAKIDEISHKTPKNQPQAEAQTDAGAINELDDLEMTIARQVKRAGKAGAMVSIADIEAEEILQAAKRRAQQIVDESEEKARKEASKKTQSQVEKIIAKAKKDAEDIIALAREATEKESNEVVAAAKQETERLIKEITEKCRRETQTQANRAIDAARDKADKLMTEIVMSCQGISLMVSEIVTRTRQTIDEFEAKLQTDVGELSKAIAEAQQRLQEFNTIAVKEKEEVGLIPVNRVQETPDMLTLSVNILGTQTNGEHDSEPLFSGEVEMKSISPAFDYTYLKNLKRYLVLIPSISYVQEHASEKETSILFDIKEPVPLLEILRNIPMVEAVNTNNDMINIVFKSVR